MYQKKGELEEIKFATIAVMLILFISGLIFFGFLYPDAVSETANNLYESLVEFEWEGISIIAAIILLILVIFFLIIIIGSSQIIPEREV